MARRIGAKKVHKYSAEFKLKAVKLSQIDGVQVQDVADALEIHPFMLSRWRRKLGRGASGLGLRWLLLRASSVRFRNWLV